jgi:CheY-like chemotaxis protein/HPt (histidine-containing phosphotransfer) domain-containing protein
VRLIKKETLTLGRLIKNDTRFAKTHLVLLSSLGDQTDAAALEKEGFEGYLNKPLRHIDLYNVLTTILSGGSSPAAARPIVTSTSAREIRRAQVDPSSRILVVEDNMTNQRVALGLLQKLGLKADAVANGVEALNAVATIPYDLVLMDVQMPEMDGLEATRRIRSVQSTALNPVLPIIAMTAHALQRDRERCLTAGMNDYVSKPIEPIALAEALERWLPDSSTIKKISAAPKSEPIATQAEEGSPLVFDKVALMQRLMGDEEMAHLIITCFLEDIPTQLKTLNQYIETNDLKGAVRQAHTIKGASANVGGEALRAAAYEIEKEGKQAGISGIQAGVSKLEVQFEKLKDALRIEMKG